VAKRPLLAVLGPTASGKTAFSIALAKQVGGEIVNADSRQLYKHLNIGTAKATPEERQGITHHLLDVLDPKQDVTIAWYQEQATRVIDDILARGKVPILVGGSMLYVSAVVDGLQPLPPGDPALRARLEAEYDADDGKTLYGRLREADPEGAAAFHQNNKPYVVRAVEILETTGRTPSAAKITVAPGYDYLPFFLDWPREEIVKRIDTRTHQLLEGGWIEEVAELLQRGYRTQDPGMKSHGYREIAYAILKTDGSPVALAALAHNPDLYDAIASKTRQYAKRQVTWWKHDQRLHVIAMSNVSG
jgi:tRNA dimethylallyltransferase